MTGLRNGTAGTLLDPGAEERGLDVHRTRWSALGTWVELLVRGTPADLVAAAGLLADDLDAVDRACSRFRSDAELVAVNAAAGRRVSVSPLLAAAVAVGLRAAAQTDGDVDPTLGRSLAAAGYDRDLYALPSDGPTVRPVPARPGAWAEVELDEEALTLRLPAGTALDLGATAKALASDRAAATIGAELGLAVLVNLGGDLAVGGPTGAQPAEGWPVRVTAGRPYGHDGDAGPAASRPNGHDGDAAPAASRPHGHDGDAAPAADGPTGARPVLDTDPVGSTEPTADAAPTVVVHVRSGGLASSSTALRRWRRGGVELHHILDPRTGLPAEPVWRLVTVAAASCVDANTASTAAVVRGVAAPAWLEGLRLPARLVDASGRVHRVAGWPEEPVA